MRPKPLMPTRTVTAEPPGCGRARRVGPTQNANDSGDVPRRTSAPPYGLRRVVRNTPATHPHAFQSRSGVEHLRRQVRLGAGDAKIRRALVGHGQQAADAAGDGVLGHRRGPEVSPPPHAPPPLFEPGVAGLAPGVPPGPPRELHPPRRPAAPPPPPPLP